jgi:hypothetical protein
MDDPAFQVKFLSPKGGGEHFASNIGPQTWGLLCRYEEIVVGGRRGGGKSKFLIAAFAMGDETLPQDDPARYSFLNDRDFRGLLLREEYQSMAEFVEEAIEFYKPFGGKPTGNPKQIDFPKVGSRIYFNHLGDEEAFTKYKGWNLTKIGIEELTQINTLRRYLKLLGSLRSVERVRNGKRYPALRTQIISTTNPDGPGANWVRDRFVEVRSGGTLIPWNTPMRDPISGMVRIFIPFGIQDNPYLSEETPSGKRYRAMLMSQDEVTRKQWMEGDWNAGTGKFFKEYRPDGPIGSEEADKYPWANHIIQSAPLKPWWYRWGSCDTGFDHPSAFHKFCRNEQDKRVHVYDEMQLRNVGYFEQGALLAKWWHSELIAMQRCGKPPSITVHMGSDAFSRTDVVKTKAEQIAAGIQEVLGPYGALLLKYNEDEQDAKTRDPKRAQAMFERRKHELGDHMHIALKPVYVDRVAAWGYVRDWLRFRPAVLDLQTDAEREKYLRDVLQSEGALAYEMQAAEMRKVKPEVLPKVQIWKVCRELDRCLKMAQHDNRADKNPWQESKRENVQKFNADENGENGDDALESFRDGAIAFKEIEMLVPRPEWVGDRMDQFQQAITAETGEPITDINRLMMMQLTQQALYDKSNRPSGGSITLPRAGSMRHRSIQ